MIQKLNHINQKQCNGNQHEPPYNSNKNIITQIETWIVGIETGVKIVKSKQAICGRSSKHVCKYRKIISGEVPECSSTYFQRRRIWNILICQIQCCIVYWSHRSHWHRAPTSKEPPKYLDLIYFCNILAMSVMHLQFSLLCAICFPFS